MGRGRVENLRTPSTEEAREIGRKGGKKSGVVRKFKADFAGVLIERLEQGETMAELAESAVENAKKDLGWWLAIRDTIGQEPPKKTQSEVSGGLIIGWEKNDEGK